MNWIQQVWDWIPEGLRRMLSIVLGSALSIILVMYAWLIWGTGYIQQQLGIPTVDTMETVTDGVRVLSDEELDRAIHATASTMLRAAMDSARQANDSLFERVSEELIRPGIKRQNAIAEQVRRLSEEMRMGTGIMDEQMNASKETANRIDDLARTMRQPSEADKMRERQNELIIRQNEAIMQKLKIQKITM